MPSDLIVVALIGLIGTVVGAIPTYLFVRRKSNAETDKLKAETEKTNAETDKIRREISQKNALKEPEAFPLAKLSSIESRTQLNFEERLKNAKTLDVLGYNLRLFLQSNRDLLSDAVKRGTTVRLVLINRSGDSFDMFKGHSNRPQFVEADWAAGYEFIGDILLNLAKLPASTRGSLKVKLTDWIPSCSLIIFDAESENGFMQVGVNSITFRQPKTAKPTIGLEKKKNPQEFLFFTNGYETLWNEDSTVWNSNQ